MANERREKGIGSYRQKSNGTWEGRYKDRSCSAKTEAGVKRALKDLVALVDKELSMGIQQHVDMTFSEWLDKWMEDYKKMSLKPATYTSYERHIRIQIKPHMGHVDLKQVSADHIQSLFQKMTKDGAKPATVMKVKNIINNAMEQAVKSRLIMFNPTRATVPPKLVQDDVRVFTPDEQTQFMSIIQGHRMEPLFLVALGTGLRRGELAALTWDCVNFDKREISVKGSVNRIKDPDTGVSELLYSTPKTRSSRRKVPMIGSIYSVLMRHQKAQEAEKVLAGSAWNDMNLVFCSTVGGYIEPRRLGTYLDSFLEKAGLEHINFHALRHTFATRFLEQGGSLKALQEILGHTDASLTLNTYAHIVGSTAHTEMSKMDELFTLPETGIAEQPKHRQMFAPNNHRGSAKKTESAKKPHSAKKSTRVR